MSDFNAKAMQEERIQLYGDYYTNKIPKRMPVSMTVAHHILAEMAGINFFDFQFDYSLLIDQVEKVCEILYSDNCPIGSGTTRNPSSYQILESQAFQMGSKGFVQHPEVIGMLEDEYDELIADPYAAILEKVIPRQHKAIGMDDPVKRGNAVHLGIQARLDDGAALAGTVRSLVERFGYYPGPPAGSSAPTTAAPYDFIADQLRSFSEISKDVRRNRNKVIAACEALYPLMFIYGLPPSPDLRGSVSMPLHMPTYMREKDFVEVWLPTYRRMAEQYAARGVRVNSFNEHDWMRYLDILQDLPAGNIMRFEYGDPKLIKEKLGKKFFIGGLYPTLYVKTLSKEANIAKVKELLDTMLPGGGYLFGFDKGALILSDIPFETYCAIAETARDYSVYDNPGQSFGTPLNIENFALEETPKLVSKYAFDWGEFKKQYPYTPDFAQKRFEDYHHSMFRYYLSLLH
ncbi:MAG: hypothetical protein FWG10_00120 [Eubacteriaceae bacterium]|nr:hypothetical protein [Eubacteriaceae bacterium]